jgi:hypothetical protein
MTSAIDPYGGNRHTLSDPFDDDHIVPDHNSRTRRPSSVQVPPPPCRKLPLCSQPNRHLGDCDTLEPLELDPLVGTMKKT